LVVLEVEMRTRILEEVVVGEAVEEQSAMLHLA
jgi:hypothetical protein